MGWSSGSEGGPTGLDEAFGPRSVDHDPRDVLCSLTGKGPDVRLPTHPQPPSPLSPPVLTLSPRPSPPTRIVESELVKRVY